jgi:hypothetical protein
MPSIDVFTPIGATVVLSVTTSSANAARTMINNPGGAELRVVNSGSVAAFVEFGGGSVAATTTASFPILPGTGELFGINPLATHVAAITSSGSTTLHLTTGRGA